MFRPQKTAQMTTPIRIQTVSYVDHLGQKRKNFQNVNYVSYANWSSYGGTEKEVDGVINIEETATLTTWYDENIVNEGQIIRLTDNAAFEIMNVENIEMRNQFMIIRVRRVDGGA